MSQAGPESSNDDRIRWPKAFLPKLPVHIDEHGNYVPVDPFDSAWKLFVGSGVILTGMHLRRIIQMRKGAQRPGVAKYTGMFQTTPRQLVALPTAIALFSFVEDSLMNLNEGENAINSMIGAGVGSFLGLIIANPTHFTKSLGSAVGIGIFYGFGSWAGGFGGLQETSHSNQRVEQKIRSPMDTVRGARSDRQGYWEAVYRRPLSETVEELGEGRGIVKP